MSILKYIAKNKSIETNLSRCGDTHIMKTEAGKEAYKNTMLKNHGVKYPMLSLDLVNNFKQSLFESNKQYEEIGGYVYVLYFKSLDLFKIGRTRNLKNRKRSLINDFGDFEKIYYMQSNDSKNLEKHLHNIFENKRMLLESGCGKTEFFKLDNKDVYDKIPKILSNKINDFI